MFAVASKRCAAHFRRRIHLHACVRDFAESLAQRQPYFPLSSKNVHILSQPDQFYARLLVRLCTHEQSVETTNVFLFKEIIRRARRRIFLSSLYIGSEEHELVR